MQSGLMTPFLQPCGCFFCHALTSIAHFSSPIHHLLHPLLITHNITHHHCLSPIAHCLSLIAHRPSFIAHCLSPIVYLSPIAHCLSPIAHRSSRIHRPSPIAYHPRAIHASHIARSSIPTHYTQQQSARAFSGATYSCTGTVSAVKPSVLFGARCMIPRHSV